MDTAHANRIAPAATTNHLGPNRDRCTNRGLQSSPDTPLSGPFGRQDSSLPQVFGRYLLVQRLSRGGMGEIFLAKHGLAGFEKLAVIKKVLPHLAADASFISRFVDEAQVAIKLSHVNVAQVFEVGRVGDEYFLALEFIDGRDLRRIFARLGHRRTRLPVDLALFIARELANGLAYAHRRVTSDGQPLNLVHCDISPPNVLVSFEGETKVIDFGIAKSVMRATATDPKVGFGKFGYMAPEQLIRGGIVDHRTDVYAAGVVLFEALTGTRLYEAGPEPNYRELARKVARGEHALPSDIDPALAAYDDLVAIALRPKAEDRYQSAAELRDAIQQCLVAVNPTISTDQLGSYMREMFVDEMSAHKELHERVANAHLADFQAQFHTQTISTVSFALAQLALPPPDATGPMRRPPPVPRARTTGPNVIVAPMIGRHATASGRYAVARPSPAHDTMAPPTDALEPVDPRGIDRTVDLPADPTPAVRRPSDRAIARRSDRTVQVRKRGMMIAGLAASTLVGCVIAWLVVRHGSRADAPPPPPPQITIEPIDPPVASTPAPEPAPAEPAPVTPPAPVPVHHAPAHRPPAAAAPAKPAAFSHDQLVQKYKQVRREYDQYKAKFGSRLENEWSDLAMFIQYMPANDDDARLREAARRLDAFRARMHN
jgi:serine/threonine protein kinase